MKLSVMCLPLLSIALGSVLTFAQTAIPEGTVLPARLNNSLDTKKVVAGRQFTARIMQDVSLPDGQKIPEGARVVGHVVQAAPSDGNHPGTLVIQFDSVRFAHQTIAVNTSLRALASLSDVRDAETPTTSLGFGTPYRWASRILVGGETYFGDGDVVTHGSEVVGRGVIGGVLVTISAPPGSRCQRAVNPTTPQALWVFSSDACGAYGFENLEISHAGYHSPKGEIQLTAAKGNVSIGSGSGLLLQVNTNAQ